MYKMTAAVIVALAATVSIAHQAAADKVVDIKQKCSFECLKGACDRVGGQYTPPIGGAGAVCTNDSKGTAVTCDAKGRCQGVIPMTGSNRIHVLGILKGSATAKTVQPGPAVKGADKLAPLGTAGFKQLSPGPSSPVLKAPATGTLQPMPSVPGGRTLRP